MICVSNPNVNLYIFFDKVGFDVHPELQDGCLFCRGGIALPLICGNQPRY